MNLREIKKTLFLAAKYGRWGISGGGDSNSAVLNLNSRKWKKSEISDSVLIGIQSLLDTAKDYAKSQKKTIEEILTHEFVVSHMANVLAYMVLPANIADECAENGTVFSIHVEIDNPEWRLKTNANNQIENIFLSMKPMTLAEIFDDVLDQFLDYNEQALFCRRLKQKLKKLKEW